jgi:hypothetical protein
MRHGQHGQRTGLPRHFLRRALRLTLGLIVVAAFGIGFTACGSSSGSSGSSGSSSSDAASTTKGEIYKMPLPPKTGTFAEEHPGYAKYGSPPLVFEVAPSGNAYIPKNAVAKEGNVTIELINRGSESQDIAVEALPSHGRVVVEPVKEGLSALAVTLNTEEKFLFYSTIPGKREAGMEGKLTVKPR